MNLNKTITITGGSGFVGKNLIPQLISSAFVTNVIDLRKAYWQEDLNSMASTYIHLAGKAHDVKNTSDSSEYDRINTELTKQIFDVFLKSNARTFIYFSSVKAVADTLSDVLTEEVIPQPKTAYGISKLKAEQYILNHNNPDKRVVILRPCMIHGPGNKGNLNLLFQFVNKRLPYPLAAFENERSFLSIDNLTFTLQRIIEQKNFPSGVYNLADDQVISTNDLIKIMGEAMGRKTMLWKIPKGFIQFGGKLGDMFHLPVDSEKIKKLTESYRVSNVKIKKALAIESFPTTAREGLMKTISSFIHH